MAYGVGEFQFLVIAPVRGCSFGFLVVGDTAEGQFSVFSFQFLVTPLVGDGLWGWRIPVLSDCARTGVFFWILSYW